jgi:GDP-mannose 4,6-dehydratase
VSATPATLSKLLAWRPGGYLRASGALFGWLSVHLPTQTLLVVRHQAADGYGSLSCSSNADVGVTIPKCKCAPISGITDQDGTYLGDCQLVKGYELHCIERRAASFNTQHIHSLHQDPREPGPHFILQYSDPTDVTNLVRIAQQVWADEIYLLDTRSHVHVSFETREYTAKADILGTARLLEAIRSLGRDRQTRRYQAFTSEPHGQARETSQRERTPFHPLTLRRGKLYAYWITVNCLEACRLYACDSSKPERTPRTRLDTSQIASTAGDAACHRANASHSIFRPE